MEFLLNQAYTFAIMFFFGLLSGLVFDLYRRLAQKIRKSHKLLFNLSDLFVGLLLGGVGFYTLILANGGDLRFYVLLAILSGIFIYFCTVRLKNK